MFSIFRQLTCIKLSRYSNKPTQTCAQPPLISTSSWNLEGLFEYLDEAMNLESSFEVPPLQIILLLFYYLIICSLYVCCSLLYY